MSAMPVLSAPAAFASTDPTILQDIRREECNLAIWERALAEDFAPLTTGAPQGIRFAAEREELPALLATALAENGYGTPHLHAALIADAAMLAGHFCDALRLARLEVRLEVVTTDSCRKFHADYVSARLITTYVGPGTDWLDAGEAEALSRGEPPRRINRMKAGDVGLFKGKLASLHPAIHRSPPISHSGETRLLLVLNPVSTEAH